MMIQLESGKEALLSVSYLARLMAFTLLFGKLKPDISTNRVVLVIIYTSNLHTIISLIHPYPLTNGKESKTLISTGLLHMNLTIVWKTLLA